MNDTRGAVGKPQFRRGDTVRWAMSGVAALLALGLTIALLASVLRSGPSEVDLTGLLSLAFVIGIVWLATALIVLEASARSEFEIGPSGFTPRIRPFAHVLRRKRRILFREVVYGKVFQEAGLWSCEVRLDDGTLVLISESQGVRREDVKSLAGALGLEAEDGQSSR
jgi:hypothetical protein